MSEGLAFIVDPRLAKTAHTLIFLPEAGEEKICGSNRQSIPDMLIDLQWQLAERGFERGLESGDEIFSRRWALPSLLAPEKTEKLRDGL